MTTEWRCLSCNCVKEMCVCKKTKQGICDNSEGEDDEVAEAEAESYIDEKNQEAVSISGDLNETFYNDEKESKWIPVDKYACGYCEKRYSKEKLGQKCDECQGTINQLKEFVGNEDDLKDPRFAKYGTKSAFDLSQHKHDYTSDYREELK